MSRPDQFHPKVREAKKCLCGIYVEHVQVVYIDRATGFKSYQMMPRRHRRPDGQHCTRSANLETK